MSKQTVKLVLLEQKDDKPEHLFQLISSVIKSDQILSHVEKWDELIEIMHGTPIEICIVQGSDDQVQELEHNIYDLKQQFPSIPIIVITESFKHNPVRLLNAGAEDCFSYQEINAERFNRCIHSALQRVQEQAEQNVINGSELETQCANQYLLKHRLAEVDNKIGRTDTLVTLIYIALDNFKNISLMLEPLERHEVLTEVTERLSSCIRESDTVTRVEGELFAIILKQHANLQDVIISIERIFEKLTVPYRLDTEELFITISMGVSFYQNDLDKDHLFKHAKQALVQAREAGGNQLRYYKNNLNNDMLKQLKIEESCCHVINSEQLEIHYQPKFSLLTSRISGTEALLRGHHPEYGLLHSKALSSYRHGKKAMEDLTDWVLERICLQNQQWHQSGIIMGPVSVNINANELLCNGFPRRVSKILRKTGLPPCLLELEIKESAFIKNNKAYITRLQELRSLGIAIAIDDFAMAYHSFNYLKNVQVDTIKIDQHYVSCVDQPGLDCAITSSLIGLARNLQINIVAQGVENQNQLNTLIELGADEVQGILLSPPMLAESLSNYILSNGFNLDMAMPDKAQLILAA